MSRGKSIIGLLALFFCWINLVFCSHDSVSELNDQVIEHLFNTEDPCIVSIDNDHEVYLNSSQLTLQEHGMFLQTQTGEYFRIPLLLSNERGCFTLLSTNTSDSTIYPVIKCWNCGRSFNPNVFNRGKCPFCGQQN